ncbi:6513_t:CDS:2 [Acaulospora morrowiae]|uniref:6513_t:CDS:1 n=1 Tax=Acaulospora morrowiae TaxID=94023 RepID=A0A9N8W3H9_9GLOM|nr:6513_t:CDS:2 [Acaulospora morrowiae]
MKPAASERMSRRMDYCFFGRSGGEQAKQRKCQTRERIHKPYYAHILRSRGSQDLGVFVILGRGAPFR